MFTGIVAGVGTVTAVEKRAGLHSLTIKLPKAACNGLAIGASIAIDGVCLTITAFSDDSATFDAMAQTLAVTGLGELKVGSKVNIERAARLGDEIGGHLLSGHIDFTAKIIAIEKPENNYAITFQCPAVWQRYIFSKGYIGVHGASLTIAEASSANHTFTVWLIPETLRLTSFAEKGIGEHVNIEIDRTTQAVVDTVISYLDQQAR